MFGKEMVKFDLPLVYSRIKWLGLSPKNIFVIDNITDTNI